MKNGRADQPGPADEWNGYSNLSRDESERLCRDKKRLYPTPRADAEWNAIVGAPAPKAKSLPETAAG